MPRVGTDGIEKPDSLVIMVRDSPQTSLPQSVSPAHVLHRLMSSREAVERLGQATVLRAVTRRILETSPTTPGGARGQGQADSQEAKVQVFLIGVPGTVLVNLLRMAAVSLIAVEFGFWPTAQVHDYGATLIIVAWLFTFWAFAHRWILGAHASDEMEGAVA